MERLIAEGRVRPARRRPRPVPEPIGVAGTVSDLVTDQRRSLCQRFWEDADAVVTRNWRMSRLPPPLRLRIIVPCGLSS